ncbi:hypothetical protein WJX84_012415 [Apatococcus fuscideae]|uniref:Uncharacterized protein n=1 Tax=Apatococcus fuscideae TaxID=2026836 RepID=A0AAW1RSE3_9CHLO
MVARRLDEERANRLQAEHEAEQAAKMRQRAEDREQQRLKMVSILDQQMADKKLQQEKAKAADMAAAKELSEQLLLEKQRLKAKKIQRSNAMRENAHQQRKAINAKTRQRFTSCRGAMDDAERKFHGSVLQGTHCGFRHLCNGSVLDTGKIGQRC